MKNRKNPQQILRMKVQAGETSSIGFHDAEEFKLEVRTTGEPWIGYYIVRKGTERMQNQKGTYYEQLEKPSKMMFRIRICSEFV